jgi:hypothetical protein
MVCGLRCAGERLRSGRTTTLSCEKKLARRLRPTGVDEGPTQFWPAKYRRGISKLFDFWDLFRQAFRGGLANSEPTLPYQAWQGEAAEARHADGDCQKYSVHARS